MGRHRGPTLRYPGTRNFSVALEGYCEQFVNVIGQCKAVDPPANDVDYGNGYYAAFFLDTDGSKCTFRSGKRKKPLKTRLTENKEY